MTAKLPAEAWMIRKRASPLGFRVRVIRVLPVELDRQTRICRCMPLGSLEVAEAALGKIASDRDRFREKLELLLSESGELLSPSLRRFQERRRGAEKPSLGSDRTPPASLPPDQAR